MVDHDKSINKHLQEINEVRDGGWDNPILVIPPFAALLVELSREARETAEKMVRLTNKLIWLTIGLLLLTAIILAVSVAQLRVTCMQQPQVGTTAPTATAPQADKSEIRPTNQDAAKSPSAPNQAPQERGGGQR
jgi:hypothetical protein